MDFFGHVVRKETIERVSLTAKYRTEKGGNKDDPERSIRSIR